jgi:hypothetical protein
MRTYGPSGNIIVNGSADARHIAHDPDRFETGTLRLLTALDESETGHAIVSPIVRARSRTVTIVFGDRLDWCGARPLDPAQAGPGGHGSDVEIEFSTNRWNTLGVPLDLGDAGASPDELLLHELVHALHMVRGGVVREPAEDSFEYREDFYAILITNIYSSNLNRRLRRDHQSYSAISESEAITLYSRHYLEIETLSEERPGLGFLTFQRLSRVIAGFNPIRGYVEAVARGSGLSVSEWRRSPYVCRLPRIAPPQDPPAWLLPLRGRTRMVVGF